MRSASPGVSAAPPADSPYGAKSDSLGPHHRSQLPPSDPYMPVQGVVQGSAVRVLLWHHPPSCDVAWPPTSHPPVLSSHGENKRYSMASPNSLSFVTFRGWLRFRDLYACTQAAGCGALAFAGVSRTRLGFQRRRAQPLTCCRLKCGGCPLRETSFEYSSLVCPFRRLAAAASCPSFGRCSGDAVGTGGGATLGAAMAVRRACRAARDLLALTGEGVSRSSEEGVCT